MLGRPVIRSRRASVSPAAVPDELYPTSAVATAATRITPMSAAQIAMRWASACRSSHGPSRLTPTARNHADGKNHKGGV